MKFLITVLVGITFTACVQYTNKLGVKKSDFGRYKDGKDSQDIGNITPQQGFGITQKPDASYSDLDRMYQKMLDGQKMQDAVETRKIAMPLPLSGTFAPIGQAVLDGAKLALFDSNVSNITILPMDTNVITMDEIASQIKSQNVDLVIGPVFAKDTEELIHSFKYIGAPIITMSNNYSLTQYPSVEVFGISPAEKANFAVDYAKKYGRCNFALLLKSDIGASEIQAALTKAIKKNKCALLSVSFYDSNEVRIASAMSIIAKNLNVTFNIDASGAPYLTNIKTAQKEGINRRKPQQEQRYLNAIITDAGGYTLDMIMSKLDDLGLNKKDIEVISLSDSAQVGVLNENVKYITYDRERFEIFSKVFEDSYKTKPSHFAGLGYDAMGVMATLFSSNNFSYNSLHASNGFVGVSGEFRFSERRVVERKYSIYEVSKGKIVKHSDS